MLRFFLACLIGQGLVIYTAISVAAVLPSPQPTTHRLRSAWRHLDPKVRGDSVKGHRLLRQREAHPLGQYDHPFKPNMLVAIPDIPVPHHLPLLSKRLSLPEAIALALRNNPTIKTSESQRILDKFALEIALQPSRVQWNAFTLSSTMQNRAQPSWSTGSGISVTAVSGTKVELTHANNLLGGAGVTTAKLTQPLLKGFGFAVNRVPYQNALDNEAVAKLTFKNSVIGVVVSVINNYRALVSAYNQLKTSKQSLTSQKNNVWQAKMKVKFGKMAPSDLLEEKSNLESTRLDVVQQEDAVRESYQTFLSTLGLVPSAKLLIDRYIYVNHIKILSRKRAVALALAHNISYQQALLQLKVTKRALITAEDKRKWTLDMTSSVDLGSERSAVGQPITSQGTNPTLKFSLDIPIDNISNKQDVVSAKIDIDNAKTKLTQQKEDLIRKIVNQWDTIHNQYQQIQISERALKLQEKTLRNTRIKRKYGKATVFEENSQENSLLTKQVNLISTKINYLNDITTLYKEIGLTLEKWHVKLRY